MRKKRTKIIYNLKTNRLYKTLYFCGIYTYIKTIRKAGNYKNPYLANLLTIECSERGRQNTKQMYSVADVLLLNLASEHGITYFIILSNFHLKFKLGPSGWGQLLH